MNSKIVDPSPLELLGEDMRAKALAVSESRVELAHIKLNKDDYIQSIQNLREQLLCHKPCSGIYIWTATANIGCVVDNWLKRMSLYETTTIDNLRTNQFLKENGKAPVVFNLTPISYQWMVAGPKLKALTGTFTLYVGQRSRSELVSRLREHCSSSAQNTAIKLAGTTVKDVRIQRETAKKYFEAFQAKDHALLQEMSFKTISCDIIPIDEDEVDQIKYYETLIRSGLMPMLGRS